MSAVIPVGEWRPDLPALDNPGTTEAKNVIPAAGSYRPFPSWLAYSNALPARVQGSFGSKDATGIGANVAGTATKLHKLAGTTWSDVSRSAGGAYATGPDDGWSFAQFGDLVIAVNYVDTPQKFQLGVSSAFEALGGSPPHARFAATVRDFVVLGRVAGQPNRVQWSGINNAETWAPSPATQSDYQDLPDGGWVQGVVGGEAGLVLQERAVQRMTYVGSPLVFQFDKISSELGASIEGSIAAYQDRAFFAHASGFHAVLGAQQLVPIGDQKVDRHFWNDLDQNYLYRVSATVDPLNKLYVVSYPGSGNSGGTPNKLLIYNWALDRWSRAEVEVEAVYIGISQAGYTLDTLDSVSGSVDALAFSLDSPVWTGVGRLFLAGFNTAHCLGYFNGPAMAATVETGEAQLVPGRRAFLRSLRPAVDGGTVTVEIGARDRGQEALTWSGAQAVGADGRCPVRSSARYHRARINVAAGGAWTHIQGVADLEAAPAGER
jgi:hypothetical protein